MAGSYSRAFANITGGAATELEVNAAYNFGEQDHWELNVVPITLRWMRFPWSEHLHTTAAFGLGLSYAFGTPELEYELENDYAAIPDLLAAGDHRGSARRTVVSRDCACTIARRDGAPWAWTMAA